MQRLKVVYRKEKAARYLSHLDLLATLEYALRRARLPLALAEGFNPRPRMSVTLPLPVGYESESEILEIDLREPRAPDDVREELTAALPTGLEVILVEEIDATRKHIASRLRSVQYRVTFASPPPDLNERVVELLARNRVEVEEQRGGSTRNRDIRPLIRSLVPAEGGASLAIDSAIHDGGGVRPEEVVAALGISLEGTTIRRTSIGYDN